MISHVLSSSYFTTATSQDRSVIINNYGKVMAVQQQSIHNFTPITDIELDVLS